MDAVLFEYVIIKDIKRSIKNKRPMGHIVHLRTGSNERSYDNIYYWTGPVVQEEKILKFRDVLLQFLLLSHNVKRCGLSIWTNSNPLYPWLKLDQWFYRRFLNFVNVFSLFGNHLPVKKGRALHLNNLIYPLPKDDLCQGWLKLDQWFYRIRFLNFVNVFSLFGNHLPVKKGRALHLNNLI